jgi:hypothetical protein
MKLMNAPIIFCHYGNSEYLPYVFELARAKNPDKRIILLGDKDNKWLAEAKGIEHYFFSEFDYGPEIETFNEEYQLIQGPKHRHIKSGGNWVNFVFKRWFYINNFLNTESIDSFWHFDSDTMVLEALGKHENKFESYDCTEQCNGSCLNGFISKRKVVRDYIDKINSLFKDSDYLKHQQEEFDQQNPKFAFTEMRAYEEFKKGPLNSIQLNTILDGSTFDDCICQPHDMEMESLPSGKTIKKVYIDNSGSCFCFDLKRSELTRMNTLNLSWVPLALFQILFKRNNKTQHHSVSEKGEMDTLCRAYWKANPVSASLAKLKQSSRVLRRSLFKKQNTAIP